MYKISEYNIMRSINENSLMTIPASTSNRHYVEYLEDIKQHGMSIVSCDDCGDDCLDIYCEFDLDEFLDETEADYLEMKAELAFGI